MPVATYTVTDGSAPDDTSTLTIAVTPVGDAFADANETVSTAEDEELTGNVLTGTTSPDGAVSVTQFVLAGSATVYLAGQTASDCRDRRADDCGERRLHVHAGGELQRSGAGCDLYGDGRIVAGRYVDLDDRGDAGWGRVR